VRGKAGVEELKGNREQIVITEIPYNVNRATLVERIAQLVNEKVLSDITAIRDESDENTRVVIELKRDANPKDCHQQPLQAYRDGKFVRGQHAGD
jgi:DNA gyrase subunit A